ncbi:MAG: type II CAAX endopeptidase family protein [Calditrichota bacterium]
MKPQAKPNLFPMWIGVIIAAVFWTLNFGFKVGNFWLLMVLATVVLGAWGLVYNPGMLRTERRLVIIMICGISAAVVLYGVFLLGKTATQWLDFQDRQLASIYQTREQAPLWLISILLIFIIAPGEEIFWRGLVQSKLERSWGGGIGYLTAALLYTLVHLPSLNLMLIGAAAVCGIFWGALYRLTGSIWPGIISHSLWDAAAFVWMPLS